MNWCVAQAAECLLCKHETLSSNPSPIKTKKGVNHFSVLEHILIAAGTVSTESLNLGLFAC
jgi:hypothetical protein